MWHVSSGNTSITYEYHVVVQVCYMKSNNSSNNINGIDVKMVSLYDEARFDWDTRRPAHLCSFVQDTVRRYESRNVSFFLIYFVFSSAKWIRQRVDTSSNIIIVTMLQRFLAKYAKQLHSKPFQTQILTSGDLNLWV